MAKKRTVKASVHAPTTTPIKARTGLWTTTQQYYQTALQYNQKSEWIAGYYTMQLCALACKHYCDALGSTPMPPNKQRTLPPNKQRTQPSHHSPPQPSNTPPQYTLHNPPPLHADDPATTLHHLYALLPLYQKKIHTFQRAFGCPRAPPRHEASTTDNATDGLADCSAITSVDLTNDESPIYFDDLIGNHQAKEAIEDGMMNPIFMPMLYPNQAKAMLFYGPPGTGKTLLARATAFELNRREALRVLFFAPTADQFKGKFVGETETKIVQMFQCASQHATELQAQLHAQHKTHIHVKSVIFIDEVDSLARRRDGQSGASAGVVASATNTLLQVMDGIQSYDNVIVLAATNYPWNIDSAILRRFGQKVYVPLPTEDDIVELLQQSVVQQVKRSLQVTKETHKRSIKEQFARWQLLHGVQEKELRVLASEMVGSHKHVGYSPRDLVRMCESVYKKEASGALHAGTFHSVCPQPNRHAHKDHTQMFEEILQSLKHTHVSTNTFDRLVQHMPHAIDTTVLPTTSQDSTFPKTITRTSIADANDSTTYTECSVLPRTTQKRLPHPDAALSRHLHIYMEYQGSSGSVPSIQLLLHRSFKVHARNQTHYVPFFAWGRLPSNHASSSSLSAKVAFQHLSQVVFVYDGRVYKVEASKQLSLYESVWCKEQTGTLVIDTSDSWLKQCVDGLAAFVPSSPRTKKASPATPSTSPTPSSSSSPRTPHTPKVASVAKKLAQHVLRMNSARGIKDITTLERFEYDLHPPSTNSSTKAHQSMKCVHTTYTIQSFVDAFGDVLPSAKMENVRALEVYHRTGKEP